MNIISLFSIFSFFVYLYLGLHILFLDKKSKVNILFFFLCLCQVLWAFCFLMMNSSKSKESLIFWYKVASPFFIPYYALVLHFCLVITKNIKIKTGYFIFLYIPTLIIIYVNITSYVMFKDFIKTEDGWMFINAYDSIWFYILAVYVHSYLIISLILLFLWNRKSKSIKEKKQSIILFITLMFTLLIGAFEGIFLSLIFPNYFFGLAPVIILIWMFGIWYSIVKYRFLAITPELVSMDIIANIDELIILLDNKLNIMTINSKTEEVLNYTIDDIKSYDLSRIILENDSIQDEIKKLLTNNHNSFSCRAHFIKKDNLDLLLDAKFKIIKDKFQDVLGILIIGKEVRELKQFKSIYKITDRQAEIIQHIISGKSNKEIANSLSVTPRTIKGHITHVYNKLRVNNKMELLNILKDFNLIPEQTADKTLLLLKNR